MGSLTNEYEFQGNKKLTDNPKTQKFWQNFEKKNKVKFMQTTSHEIKPSVRFMYALFATKETCQ